MRFTHKRISIASLFLALPLLWSCGKADNRTADIFDDKYYLVLDGTNLTRSPSEIKGTGAIVFNDPLSQGVRTNANYAPSFALEDGGSISLVVNANNKLEGGVTIELKRNGNVLQTKINGTLGTVEVRPGLLRDNAAVPVSIFIEAHNDEPQTHVLIFASATPDFKNARALVNSDEGIQFVGVRAGAKPVFGKGGGVYWGVRLNKATLTKLGLGPNRNDDT